MGTHGRGVIIIDDISPLRKITPEILESKLHFFDSQPVVMRDDGGFGGNFGTETQFVGPNPSTVAQIKYLLPKRHTFGKMTMEIKDMDDNVISTLTPGKSKGINIVNWNFTRRPPKVAKGKTFSFGGFTAPRVKAGTYKAVITKGRDVFEHTFEIVYDERTGLSAADRDFKYDTTMKLYDMSEALAYMVYQVDTYLEATVDDKNTNDKLNALKETLVITTGDNYVGSAEPQLREKMAGLYSKVAGSYDKPSPAEMANLKVIEEQFEAAKASFEKLKKKIKIDVPLKTFDEFIDQN